MKTTMTTPAATADRGSVVLGTVGLLWRLLTLPLRLAAALLGITFRTGYKVGRAPVRVSAKGMSRLGFKAVVLFFAGLAIGLLFAPASGAKLRAKLAALVSGGGDVFSMSDPDLLALVVQELSHAPRTWHLPQPSVNVVDGVVILEGEVPHATASSELERTAAALPAVRAVRNDLTVGYASN